jgi:hypothetical protein
VVEHRGNLKKNKKELKDKPTWRERFEMELRGENKGMSLIDLVEETQPPNSCGGNIVPVFTKEKEEEQKETD